MKSRGRAGLIMVSLFPACLRAQAPLVTDDAGVATLRAVHFELFAQFAKLPASAAPVTHQQTVVLTMGYGLASRFEVGFDFPLIRLEDSAGRVGTGDLNLTAKYLLREPENPAALRLALAGAVEFPTGNSEEGFGSGYVDAGWKASPPWQLQLGVIVDL